jgi:hypothetical protein
MYVAKRFDPRTATIGQKIDRQKAKLAKLEERIGQLMTQRANEEEALADLIRREHAIFGE